MLGMKERDGTKVGNWVPVAARFASLSVLGTSVILGSLLVEGVADGSCVMLGMDDTDGPTVGYKVLGTREGKTEGLKDGVTLGLSEMEGVSEGSTLGTCEMDGPSDGT